MVQSREKPAWTSATEYTPEGARHKATLCCPQLFPSGFTESRVGTGYKIPENLPRYPGLSVEEHRGKSSPRERSLSEEIPPFVKWGLHSSPSSLLTAKPGAAGPTESWPNTRGRPTTGAQ